MAGNKQIMTAPRSISKPNGIAGIGLVMLIYFFSGACSLIDEVIWVRLLKLTLGNTVYASSIVVSVFMGGLALGALIISRYADRVRRPLRLYAILEFCAAVSALALPFALRFADKAYRWLYVRFEPSPTALLFVQVIISALILLVPAVVMGSTLPILGRYITAVIDRIGGFVGRLYALNTLGAAAGCFLAGFVLIRTAGVMETLYIAAAVNVLVALSGWFLSVRYDTTVVRPAKKKTPAEHRPAVKKLWATRQCVLLLAFFASGLVSIGYELIWMRTIVILLGGFTYVFSAVLTVYLLGNVIGAWFGSTLSKRLANPAVAFAVTLTCLGTMGILYLPWLNAWLFNIVPSALGDFFPDLMSVRGVSTMIMPLFISVLLFAVPAVVMGTGFPLALQAWGTYQHRVGRTTGIVYGVNTIGAVLGGLLTGFVLIPALGVQLSITLLGLSVIWLGMLMAHLFSARPQTRLTVLYLGCAVTLTLVAFLIPPNMVAEKIIPATARASNAKLVSVAEVKEGLTTTVAVKLTQDGQILLSSDGVDIAGDDLHRVAQKTLGHLGFFLNKDAKDILSVGFGCGETTACLATHKPRSIDCVEIAPELVDVALEYFKDINLGPRLDEYVNMTYMDAKNFLYLTDKRYDLIVNDADIPSHAGSAPLFAIEHFRNAKRHLNPGGLFITKLHLVSISAGSFNSILGTFLEAFPRVTIWFPASKSIAFFYLVGSSEPQNFSIRHIESELTRPQVKDSVQYLRFNNSADVLSWYLGDQNDIRRYLKHFRINSDYKPFVEFDTETREMNILKRLFRKFVGAVRTDSLANHIDWDGISTEQKQSWLRQYKLLFDAYGFLMSSFGQDSVSLGLKQVHEGLLLIPRNPALIEQQRRCLSSARRSLGNDRHRSDRALQDMNRLLAESPQMGSAWLVRSWALQDKNRPVQAMEAAEKALRYAPYQPLSWNNLGRLLLQAGNNTRAIEHLKEAVRLEPDEATFQHDLGVAFVQAGRFEEALAHFKQVIRIRRFSAEPHLVLGNLFAQWGRKNEAVKEYRRALRLEPDYSKARRNLVAILAR